MSAFDLALSRVPPNILPNLILAVMVNSFLMNKPNFSRFLQPQRQGDLVLEMLMRMLYSDFPFIGTKLRLRLMSQFGLTIFLMHALMRPSFIFRVHNHKVTPFVYYGIDRVKRSIPSPPAQIQSAITLLSNPIFQSPPFHLSFSIDGFSNWDDQLRFNLMNYFLRSIPSDFDELPENLALLRELIVADNPFWKNLVDIFLGHYFDNRFGISTRCQYALEKMKNDIQASHNSEDFNNFARLFQNGNDQEVSFLNDLGLDSYLQVIERFITCMLESLPTLPAIRFENSLVCFSPITQLSSEGRRLSERIRQILKDIHSIFSMKKILKITINGLIIELFTEALRFC
jgi:hypothetical protein